MTQDALQVGLELTVVGVGVTFAVLGLLVAAITAMRRLDDRWQAVEARDEAEPFDRRPAIDDTTLVLLAAAAATVLQGRTRIRSVRRLLPADAPTSAWSATGRAVLQGSHVVVRRPLT